MHPPIKVAIQGRHLSFHEIAAQNYYEEPIETIYCDSFQEVFRLLHAGLVDKALIAIKNTAHGTIKETEALIAQYNPITEGAYDLPIQQHLIGLPTATLSSITTVYSHPIALSQCSKFFVSNDSINQTQYHDTSAAVELIKNMNDTQVAAVASEAAAQYHGLRILQRDIQDDPRNTTTFWSISLW